MHVKQEGKSRIVSSYAEWIAAARTDDERSGKANWREREASKDYDYGSVGRRVALLRKLREQGKPRDLLFALDEGIHGNMDGIGNPALWSVARAGTKHLIHHYVDEITAALNAVAVAGGTAIDPSEKLGFFRRALHCFGRSALLLSGSGSYLYFHVGVARALIGEALLPDIICGSSGGSLVAAMLCANRDADLPTLLTASALAQAATQTAPHDRQTGSPGLIATQEQVWAGICAVIPDLTFQQALALTGRHLNISIAPAERHQNGRLLNAIASPHVCIREAVLASCAVPGVFAPVQLMARNHADERVAYLPGRCWVDGSVTHDLPTKRLSRLYFVNHFIVSQAHPLIAPLKSDTDQLPTLFNTARKAATGTLRNWFNLALFAFNRPLSMMPRTYAMAGMAATVFNQEYSGDINIVRPMMFWPPWKVLGFVTQSEMEQLIDIGEYAAWPKIEKIRTQTLISRTLSVIVELIEAAEPEVAMPRQVEQAVCRSP